MFAWWKMIKLNIVLHEPEIPQNTGNIVRTCAATGTKLHLIKPLGFSVDDKYLNRAGLDYWNEVDITYYENYEDFLAKAKPKRVIMATTKSECVHSDYTYEDGDYIMFGKETKGIPEEILIDNKENCVRIPMIGDIRSLNLSNSVAIVLYEALRQLNFEGFNIEGKLHRLKWKE